MSSSTPSDWEIVIGLEVHAQIASTSKLFSRSSTVPFGEANTQVSLIDAAFPGMLPVPNQFCIEQAIVTALALDADVQLFSVFDRKHYFYPDLPQGYQISQYHKPIALGGTLTIQDEHGAERAIRLTRLHIEQDAGKSVHDIIPQATAIDLNRAGVALMEIVFEPDIRSSFQAVAVMRALRSLLRYLGSCDGNMEAGNLRADVNVSVHKPNTAFGTRCEIKNVNSMRFIQQAIDYEAERQIALLSQGGAIRQQTRLFDTAHARTYAMRSKEEAHDYRYFPDPDLPPLQLTQAQVDKLKDSLPELPQAKYQRFITDYQLKDADAVLLTAERSTADYFERAIGTHAPSLVARWILGPLFALLKKTNTSLDQPPLPAEHLTELIELVDNGTVSERIGKDVLTTAVEDSMTPSAIVQRDKLAQISDRQELQQLIETTLERHADKVDAYRAGRVKLYGFFVGEIMRASGGKANPQTVNALLKKNLPQPKP